MTCNMDCLHCTLPDCINDEMTPEDYKSSTRRDRESVQDNRDQRGQRMADYQKAYREANREKLAAQQKAYREANREKLADYRKAYYEANREKLADYQKAYYEANREKLAAQRKIKDVRSKAVCTQRMLANMIGVHFTTISSWENCKAPADWAKLETVFPNIKQEVLTHHDQ